MANLDNAHGFQSLGRNVGGGEPMIKEYNKLAALGQAWFRGDRLFGAADGTLTRTNTPGTTLLMGICIQYAATSTLADVRVIISPDAMLEAQGDDGTTLALTHKNNNMNAIDGTGSTTTGISGDELDSSTYAATAALDFKIIDLFAAPDNAWGEFARLVCRPNLHLLTQGAGV